MDIKEFILSNLGSHPQDIVNLAIKRFKITRPAVHKHLNALIDQGKVLAEGRTRNKRYILASNYRIQFRVPVSKSLDEDALWNQRMMNAASRLPRNIYDICHYGFTEMVNNVIDHSQATHVAIACDFSGSKVAIIIEDNGVGIFRKIRMALKLGTEREAILHLSKGKVTTDPKHHTGEGLFFTSRIFDEFDLSANGLLYSRFQDSVEDWLVDQAERKKGTSIKMRIDRKSSRQIAEIFHKYGRPEDQFQFSKTQVVVALGLIPGESYISRSQAKRILFGLEKFRHIILDFDKVSTVGQGFVDEVFRVFQNAHPDIRIEPVRANENVEFMIQRGLA